MASCSNVNDCASIKCGKVGSHIKCIRNGCACTIPNNNTNIISLETQMICICTVLLLILFILHVYTYDALVQKDFIKCSKFKGPKTNYVFKKDVYGLGYYKDSSTP